MVVRNEQKPRRMIQNCKVQYALQAVEAQLAGMRTSAPSTSPSDVKQPHKQPLSASSLGQSMDAEEEEVEDEEEEDAGEEEEDVGEEEEDEEDVEDEE